MRRFPVSTCAVVLALLAPLPRAHAQIDPNRVYRCPDNSYTNMLSVVHEKHCQPVDNANISIVAPDTPRRPLPPRAASGGARVGGHEQSQRDAEARRLLEGELQVQQSRLAEQLKSYNNGQPERLGNERNYQTYLNRVAAMKRDIDLTQANIAALQSQLARYAP